MELSQIDKGYLQQLIAYNKILNERNNLLKQINFYPALIETLDGCTTTAGPHRDDLRFKVGGIDIRKFGSQGQQRTAALSLKLSEIRLIEQVTGEKPILLLDDVLSELDAGRQSWLLESIQDIQTLISCTGLDDFVNSRISLDKVFRVTEGRVQEEKTEGLV